MRLRVILLLSVLSAVFPVVPMLSQNQAKYQRAFSDPSQYLTAKLQNLTEKLHLSQDQQERVKPIFEQEVAEIWQIHSNPVLSRKTKLDRLMDIVRRSDGKMKPLLSAEQWNKLQMIRREQKSELKAFARSD